MALYDLQRQSFTMSFLAYAVSGVVGSAASLQEELRERVDASLNDPKFTKHIGTAWRIVWGPVVYQAAPSEYADDSMFVLRGVGPDAAPVYIVAIAGTNPASAFGWLQDFAVFFPVPFQEGSRISQGTRMGVSILEALPDPTTYVTVQQFLAGVASTDATLIFTGHSLGGALAPALALDLAVNLEFDLAAWKAVFVYPSAGATPGDRAFADLFAKTFPSQTTGSEPWNVWNANVCNTLDYVPLAWSDLAAIPEIYLPHIDSLGVRTIVANQIFDLEITGSNVYAPLPKSPFGGTYKELPFSFCPFLMEEIHQHIAGYANRIAPELAPELISMIRLTNLRPLHKLAAAAMEAQERPLRTRG